MTPQQQAAINTSFDVFVAGCRRFDIGDRDLAEWMLSLSVRYLHAHGYSRGNIHMWVTHQLDRRAPSPLIAAAALAKDFGERR